MNAEINLNELFGQEIYNTIIKYNLRQNLEIGSWDGEGSTNCFVEAMKQLSGDLSLFCVDVVKDKIEDLANRYKQVVFVKPIHASSITYNQLKYKNFKELWNSEYNKIPRDLYSEELVETWFNRDVESLKQTNTSALDYLKNKTWDSVLIDGGEFTGYSEYLLIKDKTKVIFLDDVHKAFKCNQIYWELQNNNEWQLIFDLPHARNGAAAFIRK
jgi:hypothetical protein